MPYILVIATVDPFTPGSPTRISVSGLKASDIEQLQRFQCCRVDGCTLEYFLNVSAMLTALQIIGYEVVACVCNKVDMLNEYTWTLRKDFETDSRETNLASVESDGKGRTPIDMLRSFI